MLVCSSITDWIQAIAAIIAIPGAIAGFIVLFRRDKEKAEQINQLTKQTKELGNQTRLFERRIRLQFKPRVWSNGGGYHGSEKSLQFGLENRGPIAFIQSVQLIGGDPITLNAWTNEIQLIKDKRVIVTGNYHGEKAMTDVEFIVEILFRDEEYYKYRIELLWSGGRTRITKEEEL